MKLSLKKWMTKASRSLMPIVTTVSLSTNDFNIYANQLVKQGSMVFVSITATTKKSYANGAPMFNLPYRTPGRSDMIGLDAGQNKLYAFYTSSGSKTVNNNSGRTINSGETFFLKGFYYTDE